MPEKLDGLGWEKPESISYQEIGGGSAYAGKICEPPTGAEVVTSKSGMLNALSSASSGDTVYVEGGSEIDMTGETNVEIPREVNLASNRDVAVHRALI